MQIAKKVQVRIIDGVTTNEIYEMAFEMLNKNSRSGSAKYKLKKAI